MQTTTVTTVDNSGGNTDIAAVPKVPRPKTWRGWAFTYNIGESLITELDIMNALNGSCVDTWCFQLEKGANGNKHYQGQMYFKGPRTKECVRRIFGQAHVEPLKNCCSSIKYCTKADSTFIKGPWAKGIIVQYREMEEFTPRPFQQRLLHMFKQKADNRIVHWIYDPVGGCGKTTFARHLTDIDPYAIYIQGSCSNALYGIAKQVQQGKPPSVVLFGYPRSREAYVSYEAIENIKDGIFYNTKYECCMVKFPPPHIVVLANFKPNTSQLTADRWALYHINEQFDLC